MNFYMALHAQVAEWSRIINTGHSRMRLNESTWALLKIAASSVASSVSSPSGTNDSAHDHQAFTNSVCGGSAATATAVALQSLQACGTPLSGAALAERSDKGWLPWNALSPNVLSILLQTTTLYQESGQLADTDYDIRQSCRIARSATPDGGAVLVANLV